MESGPQYELQTLLFSTMRASTSLMDIISDVYDRVPTNPWKNKTAYVSFGPSDVSDDSADCIVSGLHSIQIDVWSRAVGQVEAKTVVDLIYRLLHERDLLMTQNALAEIRIDFRRVFPDRDPLITHGVLSLTASIEEPE